MEKVVLVLDVGKTNKKIALYNRKMELLDIRSRNFPALPLGPIRGEQVQAIEDWLIESIEEISTTFLIQAISLTTHGACAVCVDETGYPAAPVIDYTCEVDEGVHRRFYETVGSPDDLQLQTSTAEVRPIINVAKLLFYTRELFPREFARTKHILMYPQYFAFRLTGEVWADYTYLGCHTYLWDFSRGEYSSVTDSLGIRELLPPRIAPPQEIAGNLRPELKAKLGISHDIPVLIGVHDSNSSLIPYLVQGQGDFILNSTGTWCVAMHPESRNELTREDIGKTVFYNLSVNNTPVKTAIFLGGLEFQTWTEYLQKIHNRTDLPDFNPALIQDILDTCYEFILPGVVPGAGQYPKSRAAISENDRVWFLNDLNTNDGDETPELLDNYERGYLVLLLSLALHTKAALLQAGLKEGSPIYIEGKFRETPGYTILLASLFPKNRVYITEVGEATSYGAAYLGWAAVEKLDLDSLSSLVHFDSVEIKPAIFSGLGEYARKFYAKLET